MTNWLMHEFACSARTPFHEEDCREGGTVLNEYALL
jgi:hypothetical protein